jgi:hypothetical protein
MNTPFPQANDIYRVIWMVDSKISSRLGIYLEFVDMSITARQLEYYQNAGEFLGLISEGKPTLLAQKIFSGSKNYVIESVAQLIKNSIIFKNYYLNNDKKEVINLIRKIYGYSTSTANRRFITVKVWTKWAISILGRN